ncbi:metallo proteinase 10 [Cyathus striatus]|nr:metallo proteinase 10 [Cyathus striatus]
MVSSTFISIFLALLFYGNAVVVQAAPWPAYTKHSTHRTRHIGRGLQVEAYHPKSTYKIYGAVSSSFAGISSSNETKPLNDTAISFISTELGLPANDITWRGGWSTTTARYAFVKQVINAIPLANAVANVAFYPTTNEPVSFGSSFIDTSSASIADPTPSLTWKSVLKGTERTLDATYNGIAPSLEYYVMSDGSVRLTHVIQVQNAEMGGFLEAYVCAHSGEVLSVTDFVNDASYHVLPIHKQAFPDGLETLTDPQDRISSPFGWHSSDGNLNSTDTSGNNAIAFKGRLTSTTQQSAQGQVFNAVYNDKRQPTSKSNVAAAVTNAFYVVNTMHDVAYRYGFTEGAFNFQANNNGKGGKAGDQVLISVQDASGTNNANFATPPDGQNGICRMFIWTLTNPNRDGTMENSIIIHEFTHGITNRMTGGGTGRCLQTLESGGLGEGWGDALADWMRLTSDDVGDFVMGQYVLGSEAGIRSFPYSTNAKTNPLRYSSLQTTTEAHAIGEVWANMLHNVLVALVGEHGFSEDGLINPDGKGGNVVWLRVLVDALGLQPCNPTCGFSFFLVSGSGGGGVVVQARDAWIQADQNRFGGANRCLISRTFASRGLGAAAGPDFRDDESVLEGC